MATPAAADSTPKMASDGTPQATENGTPEAAEGGTSPATGEATSEPAGEPQDKPADVPSREPLSDPTGKPAGSPLNEPPARPARGRATSHPAVTARLPMDSDSKKARRLYRESLEAVELGEADKPLTDRALAAAVGNGRGRTWAANRIAEVDAGPQLAASSGN
jgi:hypothetical protein